MKSAHQLITLIVIVTLILTGCDTEIASPEIGNRVLLVANSNNRAGTISIVELDSGSVYRDVVGVGIVPNEIIYINGYAYIINSISADINVLTFNGDDQLLNDESPISVGAEGNLPQYAVHYDSKIYFTNSVTNYVLVFDIFSRSVIDTLPVGKSPADLCVVRNVTGQPDKLYVCNSGYDYETNSYDDPGQVYVFSLNDNSFIDSISVGINPQYLGYDNYGLMHVVCTGNYGGDFNDPNDDVNGEIHAIDVYADEVVEVLEIGGSPGEIAFSTDGYAYIAAGGWVEVGHVYRYSAENFQILNDMNNPIEVGVGAMRIVAGDDNEVYVSSFYGDRVDMIVGDSSVDNWSVGDEPGAMAFINR